MSWILRFTPRFVTVACFSETLSFLVEIYFGSAFNNPRSQDDSAMGFQKQNMAPQFAWTPLCPQCDCCTQLLCDG